MIRFPAMPWGTVPVLEVDELMIGQSTTICRYLAAEFGKYVYI